MKKYIIKVNSNKNPTDITWIWLNCATEFEVVIDEIEENVYDKFYEVEYALTMNIPQLICYIYK